MKKHFENSTQVNWIEHLEEKNIMKVCYKMGAVYSYFNVPKDVYERAEQAESIGKFLNTEIKGKYEFERIK